MNVHNGSSGGSRIDCRLCNLFGGDRHGRIAAWSVGRPGNRARDHHFALHHTLALGSSRHGPQASDNGSAETIRLNRRFPGSAMT